MSTSSKSKKSDGKITVGYVASVHGIKGEIRVVPLTDYPERFMKMKSLDLYAEGVFVCALRVKRIREQEGKGGFIFEGDLAGCDAAEKLVGLTVMIDADERIALPEGHFWIDDLIGLQALDRQGNLLGEVSDFLVSGATEIYVIRDAEGGLHYIPAVEEFVKDVNPAAGKIVLALIEGLW